MDHSGASTKAVGNISRLGGGTILQERFYHMKGTLKCLKRYMVRARK